MIKWEMFCTLRTKTPFECSLELRMQYSANSPIFSLSKPNGYQSSDMRAWIYPLDIRRSLGSAPATKSSPDSPTRKITSEFSIGPLISFSESSAKLFLVSGFGLAPNPLRVRPILSLTSAFLSLPSGCFLRSPARLS